MERSISRGPRARPAFWNPRLARPDYKGQNCPQKIRSPDLIPSEVANSSGEGLANLLLQLVAVNVFVARPLALVSTSSSSSSDSSSSASPARPVQSLTQENGPEDLSQLFDGFRNAFGERTAPETGPDGHRQLFDGFRSDSGERTAPGVGPSAEEIGQLFDGFRS